MSSAEFPSAHAVALFRAALSAMAETDQERRAPGAIPECTEALRDALRVLCAEAHARSMRAEQMLVALKHVWHTMPEVRSLPEGECRSELLGRVVVLSLDQYYAADG